MCLYPNLVTNPKYKSNKKNGGNIPAVSDERIKLVPIGCGNCIECRKQKARNWQTRLLEDIKTNTNGKFITLTFSNESIKKITCEHEELTKLEGYPLDNAIATKAVRLFNERWRKKYKKALRHWFVTELGHNGTENIHLHGIVWTNETYETIAKIWQYGYIWPRPTTTVKTYVNSKTVNYIIKYVTKTDLQHKHYKSKILTSPGIGKNYTETYNFKRNKFNNENTDETYKTPSGHKIALNTYWRNKAYSEEEREKLWIQKLNKNERWIMGEKINANDTEKYYQLLKWYREKNKELGYGSDEKNWDEEQYETQRRILLNMKRMNNT